MPCLTWSSWLPSSLPTPESALKGSAVLCCFPRACQREQFCHLQRVHDAMTDLPAFLPVQRLRRDIFRTPFPFPDSFHPSPLFQDSHLPRGLPNLKTLVQEVTLVGDFIFKNSFCFFILCYYIYIMNIYYMFHNIVYIVSYIYIYIYMVS